MVVYLISWQGTITVWVCPYLLTLTDNFAADTGADTSRHALGKILLSLKHAL